MTIKLNSIERWQVLLQGDSIRFASDTETVRRVRIDFNCAAPTVLYFEDADGPRLLAALPAGLETVEFNAGGDFVVMPDEGHGEVHFITSEAETSTVEDVDPVIYTKLAQRRHRNPELEAMMHMVQTNMERRLAAQAQETANALAAMEVRNAQLEATIAAANGTGADPVSEPQPEEPQPAPNP